MRAPTDAPSRLRENRKRYAHAVRVVEAHARAGDLERVLRSAMVAGNIAWRAPNGSLNDPGLERLVVQAARGSGGSSYVEGHRTAGKVLHVLSEGYSLGGHTRLAWRWMERDPRRSDVALTNQAAELPKPLADAAAGAGGKVHDLRSTIPSLTGRVDALRRLMDDADLVVMHVHPWDSVALAAANRPGPRPPIIYENHADHAFWLGLGCADVVMDHRRIAQTLSAELRGVRADRLKLLPLPIDDMQQVGGRDSLRSSLGLQPRDVAAVSIAGPAKMAPLWGKGFEQLLIRALTAQPRLKIFLVGPSSEGSWASLAARFQGRLTALGARGDLDAILPAMDLYLDSYPVSSGTSILEAAATALPPLSLLQHEGHRRIYHANSPGLDGTGHATDTESHYLARLDALVSDADLRAQQGADARASILATHAGGHWSRALEELYERASQVGAADLDEYPSSVEDRSYGAYLIPFMQGSDSVAEPAAYAGPLGPLFDPPLQSDLFAASARDFGPSLSVRISAGWEGERAWTLRLLELAKRYPRLAVSFPFVAGDGPEAAASVQRLTGFLREIGQDPDTCGTVSLDATSPALRPPSINHALDLVPEMLDWLETLLDSPCWIADPAGAELAVAGAR